MIKNPRFEEIKDPEALITVLSSGYERYKSSFLSHKHKSTFLPLSPISINIAETYYMNYYEVNIILGKYLDLWNKNKDLSYVRLSTFMTTYNVFNTGIIDKFFPNGRIYYNQFFQFICIMSLFEYCQIISLIMSMCKIHSNVFITKEQITTFVDTIDRSHQSDLSLFFQQHSMNLKDINAKTYSMKAFVGFINNSIEFQSIIYQLRLIVFTGIFPSKYQQIILDRYHYYTYLPNVANLRIKPKDSCVNIIRRIFSNEPSPFHYDYMILVTNTSEFRNQIDDLLLMLKQNYGYGFRNSRPSRTCVSSSSTKARLSTSKSNQSKHSQHSVSVSGVVTSHFSILPIKESPNDNNGSSSDYKLINRTTLQKRSKSFNLPKCYTNTSQRYSNGIRARNASIENAIVA